MDNDRILLAHGGGGLRTKELIDRCFWNRFQNPWLGQMDDSTCLEWPAGKLAFTADAFVVDPLFFPGGDIGRLAACGTINDLVMQGARPRCLSMCAILEEGLKLADLERILDSMAAVMAETGVILAAGDTKVVERGRGSGVYFAMSGIGELLPEVNTYAGNARPGDVVLVTGTLGDHGAAIMAHRHNLELPSQLVSDVAPLWGLLRPVLEQFPKSVRVLRDPTRGGLAAAVCDIAAASQVLVRLEEKQVPVREPALGVFNLLGLDPLHVANEGKAVMVCDPDAAESILAALRSHPLGREASRIGRVEAAPAGRVILETVVGGQRIVDIPSGEDLPRIC